MNPGRSAGERVEVDRPLQRLALRVHLEDLAAAVAVGPVDHDLAVEAAGTQQSRVEDVGTVRGCDQDDVVFHLEAVHLDEELVQRLLALVVSATEAGAAMTADRVDLVHEDDARRRLLRLLEQVTDARGADPDEHLDEVRARDREERHPGFAGDGTREQRLPRARRAVEEHALRDPGTERLELLRVLEELLDLLELLDRLVHTGDVLEADLRRVGSHPLRARLAEAHHLRAPTLHLVHQEDPEADQEQEGQDRADQRRPREAAGSLRVVDDVLLVEQVLELKLRLVTRVVNRDRRLVLVVQPGRGRALPGAEHDLGVVAGVRLDVLLQLRIGLLERVAALRDQRLAREPHEQDDHDEREKRAAEEAVHKISAERVQEPLFRGGGFPPLAGDPRARRPRA